MKKINMLLASMLASLSISAFAVDDVIYLSDTMAPLDGKSALYRVDIVAGQANLTLLPSGVIPYNMVDSLAAKQDGSVIWIINSGNQPSGMTNNVLAKYDVATATVETVGQISNFTGDSDQAAVSPDDILYVTNRSGEYYTIDTSTATATLVGQLVNANGNPVANNGGDIAFDPYGTLYMADQTNLYELTLPTTLGGNITAEKIGPLPENYTGLAIRAGGTGNPIGSNANGNAIRELSLTDASAVANYPMLLNGSVFDHIYGDMTTGPLVMCSKTIGYWKNHDWNDATVTLNTPVDGEDNPVIDEYIGRFGTASEKPYNGLLWRAKGKTYSMLYAQLIAAKLNTHDSSNIQLLNDAENFLVGKDFNAVVSKGDKAQYSALVEAVTAFNESNECDSE